MVSVYGAVLAKGSENDAVLKSKVADFERREEFGNWRVVWLWIGCRSTWRYLGWSKVGDL